jgi:hypothetical protein
VKALAAIVASAAAVVGTVEVHRPGQEGWEAVAPGSVFRVGDEVRTGALSTTRIEFVAGGGLELEEQAAVVIDTAPPAPAAPGQAAAAADPRVAVKEGVVRGFLPEAPADGALLGLVISTADAASLAGKDLTFLADAKVVIPTYQEMFEKEARLPEEERMDFVTIVTPNSVHFGPAMMALEHGFHVVVDKPITFTLDEAKELKKMVDETGLILALTHTYSG